MASVTSADMWDHQTPSCLLSRLRASPTMSSSCRSSSTTLLMLGVSFSTSTLWVYGLYRTVKGRLMVLANSLKKQQHIIIIRVFSTYWFTQCCISSTFPYDFLFFILCYLTTFANLVLFWLLKYQNIQLIQEIGAMNFWFCNFYASKY